MNYGLALSLKLERHLEELASRQNISVPPTSTSHSHGTRPGRYSVGSANSAFAPTPYASGAGTQQGQHGLQYLNKDGDDMSVINFSPMTLHAEMLASGEHGYPPSPGIPNSAAPFMAGK